MKKQLILLSIVSLALLCVSCNENPKSIEANGSYVIEENVLKVNGVQVSLVDMDQASVTIANSSDQGLDVALNNIVLGIPSATIPCNILATKADDFSFSGSTIQSNVSIDITGKISDNKISSLEVSTSSSYGIENKWMIGEQSFDGMIFPDINFSITTPTDFEPIIIGDLVIPGIFLGEIINPLILETSTKVAYGYVEFSTSGFLNISFGNPLPPIMEESADLIAILTQPGLIQYYVENGYVMLYLRKSISDMLNMMLTQQGVSIAVPSPLTIAIPYSISGNKLTFSLNQDYFKPYVEKLSAIVNGLTYEGLIALMPELAESIDINAFALFKGIALHIINDLLLNSATTYSITTNWIPYVPGDRPWVSYLI